MSESEVEAEIPFVCALFADGGAAHVSVMFGVACKVDHDQLWSPFDIGTPILVEWIERMIRDGVYRPADSDLYIDEGERLSIRLCHEADIHVRTQSASIVKTCASRWLEKRYRLLRNDQVPVSRSTWREVQSIEDAIADLE
jgi:hypothetical protein